MDLSLVELVTRERMAEADRRAALGAALRDLRRPGLRVRLGGALIALGRRIAGSECGVDAPRAPLSCR